jgi:hypothetical protein
MGIAERTFLFLRFAFVWRVRRDPDAQIMPAACFESAEV